MRATTLGLAGLLVLLGGTLQPAEADSYTYKNVLDDAGSGGAALPIAAAASHVVSTWAGGAGDWTDPARWDSNPLYPSNGNGGNTYDAVIQSGAATLGQNATVEKFNLTGGKLDGNGNLTVNGLFTWTGSTLGGSGVLNATGMDLRGSLNFQGSPTLNNTGVAVYSGDDSSWHTDGDSTINNLPGSRFSFAGDSPCWAGTLNNAGLLMKWAGERDGVTWLATKLNNSGTVEVLSGTLMLSAGGTQTGVTHVSPGATLKFYGGLYRFNTAGAAISGDGNVDVAVGKLSVNVAQNLVEVGGRVDLGPGSALELVPRGGAAMFKAGTYTLISAISAGSVQGTFGSATGLGKYVTGTGLSYTPKAVLLKIDKDLHGGDANLDTKTDISDLNLWSQYRYQAGTQWTSGDFTGNGKTDIADLNVWMQYRYTSAADAVSGNEVPNLIYNQLTGKLSVNTDGCDLFSLIVPGPKALSIDDWQDGEYKYGVVWTQAFFDGKEQWAGTNMKKVADGLYQIATYAPGLTAQDFGPVEYGRLRGDILYTDVQVIVPEPAALALLTLLAVGLAPCALRRSRWNRGV